jgi:hypothetical protein
LSNTFPDGIPTSAVTGEGCDQLAERVRETLAKIGESGPRRLLQS